MYYLFAIILPLASVVRIFNDHPLAALLPFAYAFILIPLLDSFNIQWKSKLPSKSLDFSLYFVSASYLIVWMIFIYEIPNMNIYDLINNSLNLGLTGGVIGINCAHELGHRRKKWQQTFAKTLLFANLYTQFFYEHNKGHHKNVGTLNDPTTSRYGESLYKFIPRSVLQGWFSAYKIESIENSYFRNPVLLFTILQIALIALSYFWNPWTPFGILLSACLAVYMLESVNYIEHYGLTRQKIEGVYEKVSEEHSWNSHQFYSRIHLFDLPLHSHHHLDISKPFHQLESLKNAPHLPMGYAATVLLAMVPPIWFSKMNPMIDALKER